MAMANIHVSAKVDFLKSISTSARPIPALAELIWNGFDANSNNVNVVINKNQMDGIESIRVSDNGYGLDYAHIQNYFGNLGGSWKKLKAKEHGRALHGKNGKGRFKAFSLGERIEWETVFEKDKKKYSYKITGVASAPDDFNVTEPVLCELETHTGTTVEIQNVAKNFRSLLSDNAPIEIAKLFAAYLTEYPNVKLEFDGEVIDPKDVQKNKTDYVLDEIQLSDGVKIQVDMSIVEWRVQTDRFFHLCDENGVALHQMAIAQKIRAPGFNFTVYIKTDFFRELDKENGLAVSDIEPDVQNIVDAAIKKVKAHFRKRLAEEQSAVVSEWKQQKIYPYEEKNELTSMEIAERQVFDILAVNVQNYLPSFDGADFKSKKFTFRLLAQAIQQNPESVQTIISEVLGLKKEAQNDLADLLKRTSLSSIISSAKIVANRLDFLNGLELLLFDKDNKKKVLERDQLHKILENETWLFNEEFTLSQSEIRLDDVLKKHLSLLGVREDLGDDGVDGGNCRVDLMFHKAVKPRADEYDYLIVELKRPSKKIDMDVVTQIKKYAATVAKDERYTSLKVRWTFIAISNELDDYVKFDANQKGKPVGQISDIGDLNLTVWVKTWAEIIDEARVKLHFINQQLSYEADDEGAKEYLQKTHVKFIPESVAGNSQQHNKDGVL